MAIGVAIAGLVISAGAGYESYKQNKSAQRAQENQFAIQQRQAEIQRTRASQQAIAAAHAQQAAVIAHTTASGAGGGSSGGQGEFGSIGSQIATNLGFATTEAGLSDAAAGQGLSAQKAANKAQQWQEIGALPGALGVEPNWSFLDNKGGGSVQSGEVW